MAKRWLGFRKGKDMSAQGEKVAVLEQQVDDLKYIFSRLDDAIEKIAEVNTNVSRMLAVHEERITKQEEIDKILFAKIDQLHDKADSNHDSLLSRIRSLEKRVWMGLGICVAVAFFFDSNIMEILTPQQTPTIIERTQ